MGAKIRPSFWRGFYFGFGAVRPATARRSRAWSLVGHPARPQKLVSRTGADVR